MPSLLLTKTELDTRPITSTPSWDAMKAIADGSLGTADLGNQDNTHCVRVLAAAIVGARLNDATYKSKAQTEILSVIGTENNTGNRVLSWARQLPAYCLAADFIDMDPNLTGANNESFRDFITRMRNQFNGNHGRWTSISQCQGNTANNWGTFCSAARITMSAYLADTGDLDAATKIFRRWLGDTSFWQAFQPTGSFDSSWLYNPDNLTHVPYGVNPTSPTGNYGGILPEDASRGPVYPDLSGGGISYTWEALIGVYLAALVLRKRAATADVFSWSNSALRRAIQRVESDPDSATFMDSYQVARHVPFIANYAYGTGTADTSRAAGFGRCFGYTDWIYGTVASDATVPPSTTLTLSTTANVNEVLADATATAGSGTLSSYTFEWGDGSASTTVTHPTDSATHTYAASGTYEVKVTVLDSNSLTASDVKSISLGTNQAPVPSLSLDPPSGQVPFVVVADASSSFDPDGTISTYAFEWGDGSAITSGTASSASHTYTTAGNYTVGLTITDNGGTTSTTSKLVSATDNSTRAELFIWDGTTLVPIGTRSPVEAAFTPAEYGLLTWTFDPSEATDNHTLSSGSTYLTKFKVPETITISEVLLEIVTAGATLSYARVGIYDHDGKLLGISGDQTTAWTTTGIKTMPMTTPFTLPGGPGKTAYFAILVVGTTPPVILKKDTITTDNTVNLNLTDPFYRCGKMISQTALAASMTAANTEKSTTSHFAAMK